MYAAETIRSLHQRLAEIFAGSSVLLGGSYATGEAAVGSDLDFYAIVRWRFFITRKKFYAATKKLHESHPAIDFSVMVVPHAFFRRGWYYVYGRDRQGAMHYSTINKKVIFRNSLKLARWHYLNYATSAPGPQKTRALQKSAQLAAVAAVAASAQPLPHPLMSSAVLQRILTGDSELQTLPQLLSAKIGTPLTPGEFDQAAAALPALLDVIACRGQHFLRFSWLNYLVYNAFFLRQGITDFLATNPDLLVLRRLQQAAPTREHFEKMSQIVFPVIMI